MGGIDSASEVEFSVAGESIRMRLITDLGEVLLSLGFGGDNNESTSTSEVELSFVGEFGSVTTSIKVISLSSSSAV